MFSLILSSAIAAAVPPPLVPGGCTAPAAEHMHENGCYLLAEMSAAKLPSLVYWQIIQFPTRLEAQTEARRHRWSEVVSAHDRIWLLVIGPANERVDGGVRKAIAGPMAVPPGDTVSIRFLTSTFPPGMRTRVHSHPGSEAFFVVEGEQCVETPTVRHRIKAGRTYVVQGGLHMQAATSGRKNLVALILRPGEIWSQPETGWKPSSYCDR